MTAQGNEGGRVVLVALDGSPAAAAALPTAFTIARQLRAECQALHVVSDRVPGTNLQRQFLQGVEQLTGVKLWRDMVAPAVRLWQVFVTPGNAIMKAFWHTEVRLDVGDPAVGILNASADPTVVLVVLTTHGHIIEPGRTLGRIAEQVVAETTRPILLIRPEATTFPTSGESVRRLLLPLDGTPTTAMLLGPACDLASHLGATVDLLYVVSPDQVPPDEPGSLSVPHYMDQPQHEWPQWANEVVTRLGVTCASCPPDVAIRTFLAQGEIGSAILRHAAEQHSDAVVLARRSHLEPGHAQVLRMVLDETLCPILLVGERATEQQDTAAARGVSESGHGQHRQP
jgi:nucleotide-binding universal stress UspA family protein